MVDFRQSGQPRKLGATSEVRRFIGGGYSPVYQCGYDWDYGCGRSRAELKPKCRARFPDTVLAHNAIPVELIRRNGKLPLTRDAARGRSPRLEN
jgi:hypothetical protein